MYFNISLYVIINLLQLLVVVAEPLLRQKRLVFMNSSSLAFTLTTFQFITFKTV